MLFLCECVVSCDVCHNTLGQFAPRRLFCVVRARFQQLALRLFQLRKLFFVMDNGRVAVVRCAMNESEEVVHQNKLPKIYCEVADVLCAMQPTRGQGCICFEETRDAPKGLVQTVRWQSVLSDVLRWMLAHAKCCARVLVLGGSWSRRQQRAFGRLPVAAFDTIASYQEVPSEGVRNFKDDVSLLRKSQAKPKIGTPVFVSLMPFAKSAAVHFTVSLGTTVFFRKCEQREYVERCGDGWPNICHSSACEHGTISAFLHLFSRAARLLSHNHQRHRVCRPLQAHRH